LATVIAATLIRIVLVFQGQYLFPDEDRYDRALDFWQAVSEFEPARAVTVVYNAKGRPGAIATYLPAALVQWVTNRACGTEPIQTSWIPALFTALLAGVNTLLIWWVGVKLFGRGLASSLTAILYGLFAPGLYYVQFLLPYIAAQTYLLGCLSLLPNREEAKRPARRMLLSGALFGCGFATYPGLYDQAIVVAIIALVLWGRFTVRELARLLWVPVGVVAAVLVWEAGSWLGWGPHYFESLTTLKVTILQGSFGEVWRMPFDFLWTADPLLSILLAAGLLAALVGARSMSHGRRAVGLLFVAVGLWYGLRLLLGALEKEVLYGRLIYQILPVLCLIAGAGWAYLLKGWAERPNRLAALVPLLSLYAIGNLWPFFQVAVPDRFEWQALADNPDYRVVAFVTSIEGTGAMDPEFKELDKRLTRLQEDRPRASTPVVIANTAAIYPVGGFREPVATEIIKEARHPLNIAALQFEAWSPAERDILQAQPLRVMLLKPPALELQSWLEQWGGYKILPAEDQR